MEKITFNDNDFSTLSNICRSAAQKYDEIAQEFRKAEQARSQEEAGQGMPWGRSAARLAEQFERQRDEAKGYADTFDMAVEVSVMVDPGEDEDEIRSPAP